MAKEKSRSASGGEEEKLEEGTPLCPECGSQMVEEDGELICPNCDKEIDFFGDDDNKE